MHLDLLLQRSVKERWEFEFNFHLIQSLTFNFLPSCVHRKPGRQKELFLSDWTFCVQCETMIVLRTFLQAWLMNYVECGQYGVCLEFYSHRLVDEAAVENSSIYSLSLSFPLRLSLLLASCCSYVHNHKDIRMSVFGLNYSLFTVFRYRIYLLMKFFFYAIEFNNVHAVLRVLLEKSHCGWFSYDKTVEDDGYRKLLLNELLRNDRSFTWKCLTQIDSRVDFIAIYISMIVVQLMRQSKDK